jgi:hypothetical protein
VDGCAIDDQGLRCDNAYELDNEEHFIELKGSDISHAVEQIKRSISLLSSTSDIVYAEIVSPRSRLIGNDIQKLKKKLLKCNIKLQLYKTKSIIDI